MDYSEIKNSTLFKTLNLFFHDFVLTLSILITLYLVNLIQGYLGSFSPPFDSYFHSLHQIVSLGVLTILFLKTFYYLLTK